MNYMSYAASSDNKVSQEALTTLNEIAYSIHKHSTMSQWDRANTHMKEALLSVKAQATSKQDFLKKAKQETGIAKNSHPLLVWCISNWY